MVSDCVRVGFPFDGAVILPTAAGNLLSATKEIGFKLPPNSSCRRLGDVGIYQLFVMFAVFLNPGLECVLPQLILRQHILLLSIQCLQCHLVFLGGIILIHDSKDGGDASLIAAPGTGTLQLRQSFLAVFDQGVVDVVVYLE